MAQPQKIAQEEARPGDRVCYKVPERGGFGLGFGDIIKINPKSFRVRDAKHGSGELVVDKQLCYEYLRFPEEKAVTQA